MPRIVIIGAGYAGLSAMKSFASTLKASDDTEVVVIEKSKFLYHTIGAPRAYTEASYTKNMFIPYDNVVPTHARTFVSFLRAVATSITPNQVAYSPVGDDEKPTNETKAITFDFLIVATGSSYAVPIKADVRQFSQAYTERKLEEVRDQIAKADKILVVGGGAVGCEVAADIAVHYPKKQVTIVSAQPKLVEVDDVKEKFRERLLGALERRNIRVILGERPTERLSGNVFGKKTVRTDKGTIIEADIQLLCAGFSPVAELVEALDASLVDSHGAIKVNSKMQLDSDEYPHIFAIGDVTNHPTPKMALYAGKQASHLVAELVAVVRKRKTRVTTPFAPIPVQALVLPLGPDGGVSQLPILGGVVVGDWVTRLVKSHDMMAARMWSRLGATLPK